MNIKIEVVDKQAYLEVPADEVLSLITQLTNEDNNTGEGTIRVEIPLSEGVTVSSIPEDEEEESEAKSWSQPVSKEIEEKMNGLLNGEYDPKYAPTHNRFEERVKEIAEATREEYDNSVVGIREIKEDLSEELDRSPIEDTEEKTPKTQQVGDLSIEIPEEEHNKGLNRRTDETEEDLRNKFEGLFSGKFDTEDNKISDKMKDMREFYEPSEGQLPADGEYEDGGYVNTDFSGLVEEINENNNAEFMEAFEDGVEKYDGLLRDERMDDDYEPEDEGNAWEDYSDYIDDGINEIESRSIKDLTQDDQERLVQQYINGVPNATILEEENVTKSALYSALERKRIPRKGVLNTIIRGLDEDDRVEDIAKDTDTPLDVVEYIKDNTI